MIFYLKYKALKKKLDEIIDNGLEDTLVKHLLVENGNLEATFENKTFTRILALWAKQSLEQYEAPNFLTMSFGDTEGNYELTVKRNEPGTITPAEKLVMMQKQIDSMRNCHNCKHNSTNYSFGESLNHCMYCSIQDDHPLHTDNWELKETP